MFLISRRRVILNGVLFVVHFCIGALCPAFLCLHDLSSCINNCDKFLS